jgi:hypothetical protein
MAACEWMGSWLILDHLCAGRRAWVGAQEDTYIAFTPGYSPVLSPGAPGYFPEGEHLSPLRPGWLPHNFAPAEYLAEQPAL